MNTAISTHLSDTRIREIALTFVGFLLLAASAQISIPIQPVPITLQTVAVMLIGLTFSPRTAMAAVGIYLSAAAFGIPVLSEWSSGWLKLTGASGGYLFGFIAAVFVMTRFRRVFPSTTFTTTFINCLLGTGVIFVFGIAWLSHFVGFNSAIQFGLIPFLIPGAIKALLLCGSLRFLRRA